MKLKSLILTAVIFLLLSMGCKNSTSSHGNITAADLIGSWTITHEIFDLSIITNVTTDIVNRSEPGSGSLTVSSQRTALNYVGVNPPYNWYDRITSEYGSIYVSDYDWMDWDPLGETWRYSIYTELVDVNSYLLHEWSDNSRNFESWIGQNPTFTFSTTAFTLTVSDTLTQYDYNTGLYDTAYVSGTVTAAKTHLPANHSTQVMENEYFLTDNSDVITFYDDGTFIEEYLDFRYNDAGTWSVTDGILDLIYVWTDWGGNEVTEELFFTVNLDQGQLTLDESGDACADSDPEYTPEDCFNDIAYQRWPLEGTDITSASGRIFYELDSYTPPQTEREISTGNSIPVSRHGALVKQFYENASQPLPYPVK